jgi:uncharacterized repeat protein (TIGR04138 family)
MDPEQIDKFEQAIREDGRYPPEAYEFLHRGLELATQRKHPDPATEARRHVSGQELCHALRALAVERWGPLTLEVLRRWHIRTTRDFGEMVYLMIRLGLMGKQESDSLDDFNDVYDFRDAFGAYRPTLESLGDEG